jgi:integrase
MAAYTPAMARKRGNGEGSIYKRADGRWVGMISLGPGAATSQVRDPQKKSVRKRKVVYGKTRKEVAEKLQGLLIQQADGVSLSMDKQTVAQFLTHWLEHIVKPARSYSTHHTYEALVRQHVEPSIGSIPLVKLAPQHVQKLVTQLRKTDLAPATVVMIRSILKTALTQAVRWKLVRYNAAAMVDAPSRVRQTEPVALTVEQARAFLDVVEGDRLELLYNLALSLGIRQGELLALRWDDVDYQRRLLHITHTLHVEAGGKYVLAPPKTKTSVRTLPLSEPLIRLLRQRRTRQLEERLKAGSAWEEHGLIFTTARQGRPMSATVVRDLFHVLLERNGFAMMRFHDLRHSCASLMIAQGVPLKVVQEILGHSSITVTADVYAHVFDEAKREAVDSLAKLFG